jgi:hypothetical protein
VSPRLLAQLACVSLLDAREVDHPRGEYAGRPWHQLGGGPRQSEWLRMLARALLSEAAQGGFCPGTVRQAFEAA